jgi:hypothetical protein
MEIEYTHKNIIFEKELNNLDNFVIDFCKILDKLKISYVIISGYIPILFGRNRTSEDVDMFIEKMDYARFNELWINLSEKFECLNTFECREAYQEYLSSGIALRFSKKGEFIPNMEVKFPKVSLDDLSLKERIKVSVNNHIMYISPLEIQVVFKLFLGTEKDIEDSRYLFALFKDKLDKRVMEDLFRKLKIDAGYKRYIQ